MAQVCSVMWLDVVIVLPLCFCKHKHEPREAEPKHAGPRLNVHIVFPRPLTAALVSENTLLQ